MRGFCLAALTGVPPERRGSFLPQVFGTLVACTRGGPGAADGTDEAFEGHDEHGGEGRVEWGVVRGV
jgi:hypothetical protein